jgi:hypothetical protein
MGAWAARRGWVHSHTVFFHQTLATCVPVLSLREKAQKLKGAYFAAKTAAR